MIRQISMWMLSWALLLFMLIPSTFAQQTTDVTKLNYSAFKWRGVSTGLLLGVFLILLFIPMTKTIGM